MVVTTLMSLLFNGLRSNCEGASMIRDLSNTVLVGFILNSDNFKNASTTVKGKISGIKKILQKKEQEIPSNLLLSEDDFLSLDINISINDLEILINLIGNFTI